ncbi:neuromedin-B isoform X3 [Cavia porcellus]|uniref:neuromedin-B isoform X3 n=1 Tax=Cavia porcellus TaxID=10141 RepID=UPI000661E395|nr:neuromedin-B isoform X2 [Cavia porcellus]
MTRLTRGTRLLGGFLLWALLSASVAPFSWDLPESRSRAGKIRVHPRGNLWATGHFMGKKSLEPLSPSPTGTAPHTFPRDQELQLSHDLLRSLLLRRALGLSSPAPHTQLGHSLCGAALCVEDIESTPLSIHQMPLAPSLSSLSHDIQS